MTIFIMITSACFLIALIIAFNYKKKIITRFDDVPYLVRYTLFTCKWFSIKIHNMLISDDACLHDHPWPFITFIFWRGYTEESYKIINKPLFDNQRNFEDLKTSGIDSRNLNRFKKIKTYKAPCILYRSANYTHRLIINKPAWSFVITFKKRRQWGFWTPEGWKAWFSYKQENQC